MLTCPECGRKFNRATGLGRHRACAHGIAGSSKTALAKRKKKEQKDATVTDPAPGARPRRRKPKLSGRPRAVPKRKKQKPAAGAPVEITIDAIFQAIGEEMESHAALVKQSVAGLNILLEKAKALRKEYIKNKKELQILRSEIAAIQEKADG